VTFFDDFGMFRPALSLVCALRRKVYLWRHRRSLLAAQLMIELAHRGHLHLGEVQEASHSDQQGYEAAQCSQKFDLLGADSEVSHRWLTESGHSEPHIPPSTILDVVSKRLQKLVLPALGTDCPQL